MFVLGTWNVENLFRPGEAGGPTDGADYQAKLAALAATIQRLRPDVLGLQEIGTPEALDDLVALLGGQWHVRLSEHFDAHRPIRVGVLSRHPLQVVADVAAFPPKLAPVQTGDDPDKKASAMGRGALAVRVQTPGGASVTMIVCHLKSKLLSYPAAPGRTRFAPRDEGERARYAAYALYRRAAEAVTVRALAGDLLRGQGTSEHVALVGDLNDEPFAATTQLLHGPPGSEIGTRGQNRPDAGDAWRLWNLAPLIPEAERYSRVYHGRLELIDHILVSHAMLGRVKEVRTDADPRLPSITDDPSARRDADASDHAPVVATLDL